MARPRVFVSSTYFDLKSVRADLEHFIRERGFDPVLHERGAVPYGREEALEHYCYKEIGTCDILLSLIGGRFGSQAEASSYSVSQMELKVALEQSKQVYIFVENDVYHEYRTYENNKEANVNWTSVKDVRVFQFISEVYRLSNNNPVQPFETSFDITENLKEQWAGLFQRLLSQSSIDAHLSLFSELKQSLHTARSLVDVIASQADRKDEIVSNIIVLNHPIFSRIKNLLKIPYRVLFLNLNEFEVWIQARGFIRDPLELDDDWREWINESKTTGNQRVIKLHKTIFDENCELRPFSGQTWSDDLVDYHVYKKQKQARPSVFDEDDDDVPF